MELYAIKDVDNYILTFCDGQSFLIDYVKTANYCFQKGYTNINIVLPLLPEELREHIFYYELKEVRCESLLRRASDGKDIKNILKLGGSQLWTATLDYSTDCQKNSQDLYLTLTLKENINES